MILIFVFAIFKKQKTHQNTDTQNTSSYVLNFIKEAEEFKAYKQKWNGILVKKILMPA